MNTQYSSKAGQRLIGLLLLATFVTVYEVRAQTPSPDVLVRNTTE